MTAKILTGVPCVRCGSTTKRREPKPYTSSAEHFEYVDICIYCGHEYYGGVREKDTTKSNSIIFDELKKKSYKLGLRKYRNNNEDRKFQGSPIQVAEKNLAALANCIEIIFKNSDELELDEYINPKEKIVINQVIEKLFDKLQQLDKQINNHGSNEFSG